MGHTWKMESSPAMNFRHKVTGNLPLEEEEHVSQKSRVLLLSEPDLQRFREDVGRPVFNPTYFYQKELEVVVGALHLPENNFSFEEQKQVFSAKNCVVVLSDEAETWFDGRRKNGGARLMCFFFFQAKPRARYGRRRRIDCGASSSLEDAGKKGRGIGASQH